MGRERHELTAHGSLSDHGTEQDNIDARLWNEFIAEVEKLAENPRYADIGLMVYASPAPEYGHTSEEGES